MGKKIGILTFHASHNYGSMLQAYALQSYLKEQGHDVIILNFRHAAQMHIYMNPLAMDRHKFKQLVCHPIDYFFSIKKWYRFERFMTDYYAMTPRLLDIVQVQKTIDDQAIEVLITGGDQIWNMSCADFSIAYYLPFDVPGVRKVAYAPSLGGNDKWAYRKYAHSLPGLLNGYDCLSVREHEGSQFLSSLLGRDVPEMTDPTLLLDKEAYQKLIEHSPIVRGKYLFYYSPNPNPRMDSIAVDYARKNGLKIITSNGSSDQCEGMERVGSAGPLEFLNLLANAEVVCGKSFHLAVFSILFHKRFFSICGDSDARMAGLLSKFGLSNLAVPLSASGADVQIPDNIDWEFCDTVLQDYKRVGVSYLSNALDF